MRTIPIAAYVVIFLTLLCPGVSNATPINLALNQSVTFSSDYYGTAASAVDGNIDTMWGGAGWDAWLQVDLGAVSSVGRIVLWGYNSPLYGNTFTVSAGIDSGSLATIGSVLTPGSAWTPSGPHINNYWTEFLTPGLSARYIRVSGSPSGPDWASFSELEVFGSAPAGAIPEPSAFVLLGSGLVVLAASRCRKARLRARTRLQSKANICS
jgi:hypothetical protein